jgi:hypothetical protein
MAKFRWHGKERTRPSLNKTRRGRLRSARLHSILHSVVCTVYLLALLSFCNVHFYLFATCFYCFILISHVITKGKRWRTPGRSQCCLPLPPTHAMCLVWVSPTFSSLSSSFQFLSESSEADNHLRRRRPMLPRHRRRCPYSPITTPPPCRPWSFPGARPLLLPGEPPPAHSPARRPCSAPMHRAVLPVFFCKVSKGEWLSWMLVANHNIKRPTFSENEQHFEDTLIS